MKSMHIIFIALCILLVPFVAAFGQITTNGTGGGAWSSTSTWAGGVVPDGSGIIAIASTDSVLFDVPVTITGTLVNQSTHASSVSTGSLTFGDGSNFNHAVNGGSIPIATWATGSTCTITGVTSTAPGNSNQSFYNFTWNCKSQSGNVNVGWNNITIGGNVDVSGTGSQFRLTNNTFGQTDTAPNIITINGNVTVHDTANFTATGSGTPVHYVRVIVNGDVTVSGGTGVAASTMFQLANGSGCAASWWMRGNVTFSNCTTTTNNTSPDSLIFCGTGIQTLTNSIELTNYNIVIAPGASVAMGGSSTIGTTGQGSFTMADGATFICGHASGLSGNISNTTTKTFGTACNFVFNGSEAQVTSALMPATVKNVTINNAANVTSSQALTITDTLFLLSGSLLGTFTAGTTTDVEENIGSGLPGKFFVNQNYPNPFNPSTTIMYGIPKASYVSVKVYNLLGQQVATLFSGYQAAGTYPVTFKADQLSSGVYLYRVEAGQSVEVKRMLLLK